MDGGPADSIIAMVSATEKRICKKSLELQKEYIRKLARAESMQMLTTIEHEIVHAHNETLKNSRWRLRVVPKIAGRGTWRRGL